MKTSTLLLSLGAAPAMAADYVFISTFDGAASSTQKWHEVNDPVMGGRSSATFEIDSAGKFGVFNGTTAIVPSLKAPGFCNAETENYQTFPDASGFDNVFIVARTTSPTYAGFKLSLAADTLEPQFKSFKANFNLTSAKSASEWTVVNIPLTSFSNDWSPYTGDCDTKDPTGTQHHCCSADHPEVCAKSDDLKRIEQVGIWSEGHEGDFHLEVLAVGVGKYTAPSTAVCKDTEYCCPEAKKCLTPTQIGCASDPSVCSAGTICCPLTKLCVTAGDDCTPPAECKSSEYCCPDALHCLTPTQPGTICGGKHQCASSEICCPLTHECVTASVACTPP